MIISLASPRTGSKSRNIDLLEGLVYADYAATNEGRSHLLRTYSKRGDMLS